MIPSSPSADVVFVRIRNRIIEYLRLLTAPSVIRAYQRDVPYADVFSELFEQWFDWVPDQKFLFDHAPSIFTGQEIEALRTYQTVFEAVVEQTPRRMNLEHFLASSDFVVLSSAAGAALVVLMKRGILPEDE